MPIRPPRLDDRAYDDLVAELLARIPAHTPEYTFPEPGDPGRTLIELFAWLADTVLYRVNLIPDQQRLEFLRLVGASLRGPRAATGLVALRLKDTTQPTSSVEPVRVGPGSTVTGPTSFETTRPVTVHPVVGEALIKRRLRQAERDAVAPLLADLAVLYELGAASPAPYVTTPVFADQAVPAGVDLVQHAVDRCLWFALRAGHADLRDAARLSLGGSDEGERRVLTVGVMPAERVDDDPLAGLSRSMRPVPHVWEMTTGTLSARGAELVELDVLRDGTDGLSRAGTVDLLLPPRGRIGAPPNDVGADLHAGAGARPPRLDDATDDRLVTWLRLRPLAGVDRLSIAWAGLHAVPVDHRLTLRDVALGVADGTPEQEIALPRGGVDAASFQLQVEEANAGWRDWGAVPSLIPFGPDARAVELDPEEGRIRFGDGLRGRLPEAGRAIRAAFCRCGGGPEGNLPPGSLTAITARAPDGSPVSRPLGVGQPAPTRGGAAAETLDEAERRIPSALRHGDRAVSLSDYVDVAAATPGVRLGRIEVIAGFRPHQRRTGVPGVVSVMVLPFSDALVAPNPRPGRHTIESVYDQLSPRVPLGTELYVIGCAYRALGVGVAYEVRSGFSVEDTSQAVRIAVRAFLWPVAPGGPGGGGWPRGRAVRTRELEVVVARVPGVDEVGGVSLFTRTDGEWSRVRTVQDGAIEVSLDGWELPEMLRLVVVEGAQQAPDELDEGADGDAGVPIPVVPELC